jgi:phage baseplate assembly protein W
MALDAWPANTTPVEVDPSRPAPGSSWTATIAAPPTAAGVEVILPQFSATQRWGPCPWLPRGTAEPQAGDRALVVFADNGATPWVVQWGDVGDDVYPPGPVGPAGVPGLGAPDWDSGWYAEQATTTHITTKTHNLALTSPPRVVQLWFAPDLTPTRMEPVFLPQPRTPDVQVDDRRDRVLQRHPALFGLRRHLGLLANRLPPHLRLEMRGGSMPRVEIPHLSLPLRYVGGRPAVNEQDSLDDVSDCVEAALRTRPGQRLEHPDYGTPEFVFAVQPLDMDDVIAHVLTFEPRAHLVAETAPDRLDEAIARARLTLTLED